MVCGVVKNMSTTDQTKPVAPREVAGGATEPTSGCAAGAAAQVQPCPESASAAPGAAAVDIEALKAQAAKAQEYLDRLLRTAADFDNFKKRVARERAEAAKYMYQPLLVKLLPVLDNLENALAAADHSPDTNVQALRQGVSLIQQQLKTALSEVGLEEIDALNQKFDPHLHEAVGHQETTEVPDGHVLRQVRKGYKLRDRLLRPASVVVAKAPAGQPQPAATPPTGPAEPAPGASG